MKILMLSWEYPPKNVGGISNHVYYLSHALKELGHEVYVVTCEEGECPKEEVDQGVRVYRTKPYDLDNKDFTRWVMHLNFAMIEKINILIQSVGKFDILHIHDWLAFYAGKVIKDSYHIPIVCTIHATEYGRNNGIRTDLQRYIFSVEETLVQESCHTIVCSKYMRQEISELFKVPWEQIEVIPNGVRTDPFEVEFDKDEFKKHYALEEEKIIFYVGRHVFEKGIHLIVEVAPRIIENYRNVKFIIAGTGPMTEELKHRTRQLGIENKFWFTGYMLDSDRNKMYKVADVAVLPSLYEPFGIVVLEAMAAGCPVVAADTGGMGEIIHHKVDGLKFICGSTESLYDNIMEILEDPSLEQRLSESALQLITEQYNWQRIAAMTSELYGKVKTQLKGTEWEIKRFTKTDRMRCKKEEALVSKEASVDLAKEKSKKNKKGTKK